MAGIYIHIPFCRQKCYYCDFYKTVNTTHQSKFIAALKQEINQRKNYLANNEINTIYFGGGTPSVLLPNELEEILKEIHGQFQVSKTVEITFEANPDDLLIDYLKALHMLGINRLSIGIQSLNNELLQKMNRRHDSNQAFLAIENAVKTGFKNITVDLIYGIPGLSRNEWKKSLEKTFTLPVQHLSAYHLTYHEGTPFYSWLKKGTLKELSEPESIRQFEILVETAEKYQFEQYEISNFARDKQYSKHNTAYWLGIPYLGLGPSAHSFNGNSRRWNIAHIERYISAIEKQTEYFQEEILSDNEKYNEFILTRIRTIWGISEEELERNFGAEKRNYFMRNIEKYFKSGLVIKKNNTYNLTVKGLFVSDEIMANLMYI